MSRTLHRGWVSCPVCEAEHEYRLYGSARHPDVEFIGGGCECAARAGDEVAYWRTLEERAIDAAYTEDGEQDRRAS